MTPLRLRFFSSISNIAEHLLQALALRLLPEPSQLIREQTQAILRACCAGSTWEPYEKALIQAEDHRFHFHKGVDCIAITRALYQTLVHRCRQGGSTIEQQLVRTLTRDHRRNYSRKARELLLASTLARTFSKQEVLRAYLSVAYFGTDMVGLPQAIKNISIPAAVSGCPEAYLIAHLRYPKPRKAEDQFYLQRQRRAAVTLYYCKLSSCHSLLLTRYRSRQLFLLPNSQPESNHKT